MPDDDRKEWSRSVPEILFGGFLGGVAFFAGGALFKWIASKQKTEDGEREE